MTTIAYHHESKTIAFDSRVSTTQSMCSDTAKKWFEVDSDIVISCGECADIYELERDWILDKYNDLKCEFMLIRNEITFYGYVKNGRKHIEPLLYNFAIGSGAKWAIAAMDFKKDAFEAVEYAKERDFRTGGKIQKFNVYTENTHRICG